MFFRWVLPLSVTLVLGVLIGRLSVTHANSNPSGGSHDRKTLSPSELTDDSGSAKPNRSRERGESPRKASDGRVSIQLPDLKEFLSGRVAPNHNFENIADEIDPLLSLLGANANEREEIKMIFRNSKDAFLQAEKEKVRIKNADDTRVILDMSGMATARVEITQNTRDQIKSALDPERAAILEKSIYWDGLYRMPKNNEVKLSITRAEDALFIREDGGSYTRETRLDETKFPRDSQSIPGKEAFTRTSSEGTPYERWTPFLEGKTLRPAEPPANEKPAS